MKKIIISIILFLVCITSVFAQCVVNYGYSGSTDSIQFANLSLNFDHYYWNFGDGSGSNDSSPLHVFPDDGEYLVTLYGLDSISNCSNYKSSWIQVLKPDTFACDVKFTTSLVNGYSTITDLSTNCNGADLTCPINGPAYHYCGSDQIGSWGSVLLLQHKAQLKSDSIFPFRYLNGYYRTLPYQFNAAVNYQKCSSNFEYITTYEQDSATITFTAMSKNNASYQFSISGFGDPINLYGRIVKLRFPYETAFRSFPWTVHLITTSVNPNCTNTSVQQILIKNLNYQFPISCEITKQPINQIVNINQTAKFSVAGSANANYQWQQDMGTGFLDLFNAGKYSGVNTKELLINAVTFSMNNYKYRCLLSGREPAICSNTSVEAILNQTTGFNSLLDLNINIYPNPFNNQLNISLPPNNKSAELIIYSIEGIKCFSQNLTSEQNKIDLCLMSSGTYLVEIKSEKNVGRQLFIKE